MKNDLKLLNYFRITDIWQRLCEAHNILLDLTCREYSHLLGSEIDAVESIAGEKRIVIEQINSLNDIREELVDEIASKSKQEMPKMADLLSYFSDLEDERDKKFLTKFNNLLIDLIEKIQVQNKTNQKFINKALENLDSYKNEVTGKRDYKTYDARGITSRP